MRALPGGLERQTAQLRRVSDVLATGHPRDMAIPLRRIADPFPNFAAFPADVLAQQPSRAGSNRLKLQQAFHESAFAGAVGAEQANGARRDLQVHALQGPLPPVGFAQAPRLDDHWVQHFPGEWWRQAREWQMKINK